QTLESLKYEVRSLTAPQTSDFRLQTCRGTEMSGTSRSATVPSIGFFSTTSPSAGSSMPSWIDGWSGCERRETMTIADLLQPEFDEEMATTRRVLERVPEDKFSWKPHDKSFSMGDLASHIVNAIKWTDT